MNSDSLKKLRIAYVVHDYNRHGGHSRYVAELATRFRNDHEIHVFTNTVDEKDAQGIHFHHVPAWRRNALTSILTFILPATIKVRGNFDIIHAQGLCGLRHNLATAHFCQTAWFDAFEKEGVPLTWRQKAFRILVTSLEKLALCKSSTKKVIAVSERVKANLDCYYGRKSGVEVIYHGTDTVLFHPENKEKYRKLIRAEFGIPENQFIALYVGDMKKGAIPAINAIAKVPGAKLLIVSGSEQAPYKALIAKENVEDRVIIHPHSKQVEKYFAMADAFVFPTIYDPFGLVITEAMAAGLPVITSRMAGAAELIENGVDGILTDKAWSPVEIARHLECLRDDPGLRERMGRAARVKVEPLTWNLTASRTMSVYQELASVKK